MGILNYGKRAARFTFVKMPLSMLGVTGIKAWNGLIVDLWKSSFGSRLICPDCNQGVINPMLDADNQTIEASDNEAQQVLYPWSCNHCDFQVLAANDPESVRSLLDRHRVDRLKTALTTMEIKERESFAKSHRIQSRVYFLASTLTLIGCFYMLATGAALLIAFNWLAIAFVLWVYAMKKSYRCWQAKSGTIFVEGSFWFWFKNEKWIV